MKYINWIRTHRYCLAGLYLFVFLPGFFLLEYYAPQPKYIMHSRIKRLSWIVTLAICISTMLIRSGAEPE